MDELVPGDNIWLNIPQFDVVKTWHPVATLPTNCTLADTLEKIGYPRFTTQAGEHCAVELILGELVQSGMRYPVSYLDIDMGIKSDKVRSNIIFRQKNYPAKYVPAHEKIKAALSTAAHLYLFDIEFYTYAGLIDRTGVSNPDIYGPTIKMYDTDITIVTDLFDEDD